MTAVLGGGWGVVARIQPAGSSANQAAKTVIRPAVSGGFSSAGAMRSLADKVTANIQAFLEGAG